MKQKKIQTEKGATMRPKFSFRIPRQEIHHLPN